MVDNGSSNTAAVAAAAVEQDRPNHQKMMPPPPAPQDVPQPTLSTIPPVVWEQILSFLPSQAMCMAATEVSKTLSGVTAEDRTTCLEHAAKLALKYVMEEAMGIHHMLYQDANRGKVLHSDDMFGADAPTCASLYGHPAGWTPPKLDGESYHRTYHLACEMLHGGACHIRDHWDDSRENNNGGYHIYIVAYLLYGGPPLPPLDERQLLIAEKLAFKLTQVVAALLFRGGNDLPEVNNEARAATKAQLDFYCRGRILRIAKRLYIIGDISSAILLLDLLTYNCAQFNYLKADASIYDVEYFLGYRVILQGLSRADLNGRVGEVEKTYNNRNGRIGILLDCAEGESTRRLVGIKPANLRAEKEDSDLVIDQKLLAGHFAAELIMMDTGNLSYPVHMSREIHHLRQVCKMLSARIEASGKAACASYVNDGRHAMYRCDTLRLFNARIALSRLLFYRASKVGCGEISYTHGGVSCAESVILDMATANGENDTVLTGIATESLLREGADALSAAQDLGAQFDMVNEDQQVGMLGQALPTGAPTASQFVPMKDYCFAFMHATVTMLTHGLRVPFLQLEEDAADNLELHAKRAAQFYREWLESFLSVMKARVHPKALTVEDICSHTGKAFVFVIRDLLRFLMGLSTHYLTCAAAEIPLRAPDECGDFFYFIGLGVALALRHFGTGHDFTKRWASVLQRLTEPEESPVDWRSNPLEDPPEALENVINAWLANGGFRCLYV